MNVWIQSLNSQLAAKDGVIAGLNSQLEGKADLEAAIAGLEAKSKDVIETVASLGFAPNELPASESEEAAESKNPEAVYKQWKALKGSAGRSFYEANKTVLRSYSAQLAARQN